MYSIIHRYCNIRYISDDPYKKKNCVQFYNLYPMKIF